jgi:O-antigen ligase
MPALFATFLCILFILYLFRLDLKHKLGGVSNAIWIPLIWMLIGGSRFISHWLAPGRPISGVESYIEGSPVDRIIFLALILVSFVILSRRRIDWSLILNRNLLIWVYFAFGALSICWSDYPFVALKRWVKTVGSVSMVLVIMTEVRPYAAIEVIFRRIAILLLPLSILFIKYYPEIGRAYHMGMPMYTGVTTQKNSLGALCLALGIYFCWQLLINRQNKTLNTNSMPNYFYILLMCMIVWLLYMANSATSFVCLIVALCLFIIGRMPIFTNNPRRLIVFCIICLVVFAFLDITFEVKDILIRMLGRRPDLTTRVPMWEDLLSMVKNPLIGFGWESFWLGDRQQVVAERWGIDQNAHNGYLEMYLNLGFTGLLFLIAWILSGVKKIMRLFTINYAGAILKLSFLVVVALYNWTEATFYGVSLIWILFLLSTLDAVENEHFGNKAKHIPEHENLVI